MSGTVLPIKRACVSAAVEIVIEETLPLSIPAVNHDTVPTCKKCQRERNRNRDHRQKQKGKKKQNRANTPIVIQLKDTLKAAMVQRQKTRKDTLRKQDSIETRDEADVETDNSSDRGDSDFRENQNRKNTKNFSAFIGVMEKVHQKENKANVQSNLSSDNPFNEKLVAEYVLNNAPTSSQRISKLQKKKNITDCDNVDIICNDLNGIQSMNYDTEESEISSTTSSSEIQSDSDIPNTQESPFITQEFSTDELQRLAEYTTGCPLIRYDCSPSHCPQCQWYESQYYTHTSGAKSLNFAQNTQSRKTSQNHGGYKKSSRFAQHNQYVPLLTKTASVEVENISNTDSDLDDIYTDTPSETSVDTDINLLDCSPISKNSTFSWSDQHYTSPQKPLFDIDIIGNKTSHSHSRSHKDIYLDSVYVDLTDTNVTFTVYYYHDLTSENQTPYSSYARYSSSNIAAGSQHHGDLFSYYSMPYYYSQCLYWSGYLPPLYNLPVPLCLQPDEVLPKIAMVPPEELTEFTASQPPQRQWIPLSRPQQGRPAAIFTVMCYNVLCDKYCTRQQYGYCPSWGLNWEYRKKGIMDEIRNCSADIISLQEVETDQFFNFFKPELEREGYQGIFAPKSRARTMTEQERKHVDGCAIFFRNSKFSLAKEHLIEFNQLAMANAEGSDEMLNRVMTKDNIGLAALLETREGVFDSSGGLPPEGQIKQPIIVTTAHMHWDPEFSDVKLIQTMMLMSELKKIVEDSYRTLKNLPPTIKVDCNTIPVILCGDLNSLPNSGVIEYLSSGRVPSNHIDFKELGYEACLQSFNCIKDSTHLSHNFQLAKAYEGDLMPHTNYTFDFKGIIDYIFFSKHYMKLLGVLGPMDDNWFVDNKVVGCPHPHIPSDHFSLFVEFEMPVPYPDSTDSSSSSGNHSSSNSNRDSNSTHSGLPSKLR